MNYLRDLSKREKILIYILSLMLIIFIYFNLIRPEKSISASTESIFNEEFYTKLVNERNELESEIDELDKKLNNYKIPSDNFGENLDLKLFSEENKIELLSQSVSRVEKLDLIDSDIFYINTNSEIEGNLEDILKVLNHINLNNLYIDEFSLNRKTTDVFSLYLSLKEYTISDIPFTGIVSNEDYSIESVEDNNLLDSLYGEDDKDEVVDDSKDKNVINNSSTNNPSSYNNDFKNNQLDSKDDTKVNVTKDVEKDEIVNKDYSGIEIFLENLESIENKTDKKLLFNLKYFEQIKEEMLMDNLIENFNIENEELVITFEEELDLMGYGPVLDKPCYLLFDFDGSLNDRYEFIFIDKEKNLYKFETVKQFEDFQSLEYSLKYLKEKFPLKLNKIKITGGTNGKIKNFSIQEEL